jgi:membrane-associated protease RseP (regulator of RpoE activity)
MIERAASGKYDRTTRVDYEILTITADDLSCSIDNSMRSWYSAGDARHLVHPGQMAIRVAVCTTVVICGLVLPGRTQRNGPAFQLAQRLGPCGWMGVPVRPMTPAFAASLGMAESYGAIFDQPEPKSPAAKAGIQAGDVLTAINGSPVMRSSDVAMMISAMAPGSTVYLNTFRNRQMIKVSLILDSGTCVNERTSGASPVGAQSPGLVVQVDEQHPDIGGSHHQGR